METVRLVVLRLIGFSACLLGVAAGASAQDPLEIQNIGVHEENGRPNITYRIVSHSAKEVFGYIVKFEFGPSATASMLTHTSVIAQRPNGSRLKQGGFNDERIHDFPPNGPDGKRLTFRAEIDSVLFADGSFWGPDSTKHLLKLEGIKMGVRSERMRLKNLLATSGAPAVMNELK